MPTYFRLLLAASGLILATTAAAQRRTIGDLAIQPEGQVEVALQGNDYVLAGVNVLFSTNSPGTVLIGGQLRLGYEHFWNERWSWGGTFRALRGDRSIAGYGDIVGMPGNVIPGLLLRHTSQMGGFTFGQRLGAEYAMTFDNTVHGPNSINRSRALARLRLDVERQFALGAAVVLRPRLSYEPVVFLRLQRPEGANQERVVDFASLRAELGLRLSPQFDVTPWASSQTIFLNALPQFDANGNLTGGGRVNLVVPVVGFDVRLTLFRGEPSAERKQLPTQH
ncbi:hypothetical protein [Hymenobacter sp. B1770]|uniref:hypothetical protein n=1 Tax=Hymenobacter sp. B1770 TaxID=1718788 RepID=UPI003CE98DDC